MQKFRPSLLMKPSPFLISARVGKERGEKNLKKPIAQFVTASDYQICRSVGNKVTLERSKHFVRSFVEISMLEFQIGNDERLGFHLENRTVAFVKLHNIGLTG